MSMIRRKLSLSEPLKVPAIFLMCWLFLATPASAGEDVWTSRNDGARTGANLKETILTTSSVNPGQFGQLFSYEVEGNIFAQPLVITNVKTEGNLRNVVYVATTDDIVYAFDADSKAQNGGLIWRRSFATGRTFVMPFDDDLLIFRGKGATPIPAHDPAHSARGLTIFQGNLGIVGTPVIDRGRGTMYLVVRAKDGGNYVQDLHAIDIANGQDRPGSPVPIARDPSPVSFAGIQNQRAGLALVNNRVVVAWGGGPLEDNPIQIKELGLSGSYHGYVMAYDAGSLAQTGCFTTGSEQSWGVGIWQSGRAPVVDGDGYVYYFTGNGWNGPKPPASVNQCDRSGFRTQQALDNSLIKLDVRKGVFLANPPTKTQYWQQLDDCDMDLGGSGPMLIPGTGVIVGGGKQGFLHVFKRTNGQYTEASSVKIYDEAMEPYKSNGDFSDTCKSHGGHHVMGGPVYWESDSRGPLIYVSAESDTIKAYSLSRNTWKLSLVMKTMQEIFAHPGAILSLSANGNKTGTGVLWAVHANRESPPANHDDVYYKRVAGVLRAYDAEDLSRELWNSNMCPGDSLGDFAKFTPPTIANGKVYMATFSGKVVVYGLLRRRQPCR